LLAFSGLFLAAGVDVRPHRRLYYRSVAILHHAFAAWARCTSVPAAVPGPALEVDADRIIAGRACVAEPVALGRIDSVRIYLLRLRAWPDIEQRMLGILPPRFEWCAWPTR
jgi:hypothetical protein